MLYGRDIMHTSPNLRPANTVFQSYALFLHLTVAQNVGFGLKMKGNQREALTMSNQIVVISAVAL